MLFNLMALTTVSVICMQPSVDVKTVMSQLMERLSKYAAASPEVMINVIQCITNKVFILESCLMLPKHTPPLHRPREILQVSLFTAMNLCSAKAHKFE